MAFKNTSITIITAIFLSIAFFIFPKFALAQVIINEIMYDLKSVADDKHEWLEIKNTGSSEVDLTGWKFNDGDTATNHALNPPSDVEHGSRGSMILPVGGYLLLADNAGTLIADLPDYQGTIIDTIVKLSNTSATLKLLNSEGQEIAAAFYSKEMGAAGSGKTLEWDGSSFKESFTEGGTPGLANSVLNQNPASPTPSPSATPSPTPSPAAPTDEIISPSPSPTPSFQYSKDIFINEFLPNPEDGKEWVELFNASAENVNLSGWKIGDGSENNLPQAIPAGSEIKPQDFLVVVLEKTFLNNDGDKIRLIWPDNQVVHSVSYERAIKGESCARFGTQWFWTNQPTPGQPNKKSLIENKSKSPSLPQILTREENAANVQPSPQNSPKKSPAANKNSDGDLEINKENPEIFAAGFSSGQNPENPPTRSNQFFKIALALFLIIFLSALTGLGLVFFRRQKIDRQKTID